MTYNKNFFVKQIINFLLSMLPQMQWNICESRFEESSLRESWRHQAFLQPTGAQIVWVESYQVCEKFVPLKGRTRGIKLKVLSKRNGMNKIQLSKTLGHQLISCVNIVDLSQNTKFRFIIQAWWRTTKWTHNHLTPEVALWVQWRGCLPQIIIFSFTCP